MVGNYQSDPEREVRWLVWCRAALAVGDVSVNAIEEYIRELEAALRGPRRARVDLLTEARDALVDAADAFVAGGSHRGWHRHGP